MWIFFCLISGFDFLVSAEFPPFMGMFQFILHVLCGIIVNIVMNIKLLIFCDAVVRFKSVTFSAVTLLIGV